MNSFYSIDELKSLGFGSVGNHVLISRKASFYDLSNIHIGNNVRIDDFCIVSGKVSIGSHVHISAYVAIYGKNEVILEDYTGLSPRTTIYSAMDDFSGDYLIGPIHDSDKTNVQGGPIRICKYSQIGANCILFPNVVISEGVAVGAMSIVKQSLESWGIYAGIPVKRLKDRSRNLLNLL